MMARSPEEIELTPGASEIQGAYYPWLDDPDKDEDIPGHGMTREQSDAMVAGLLARFLANEQAEAKASGQGDPAATGEPSPSGPAEPDEGTPVPDPDDEDDLWHKIRHPQWGMGRQHLFTGEERYGDDLDLDEEDRRNWGVDGPVEQQRADLGRYAAEGEPAPPAPTHEAVVKPSRPTQVVTPRPTVLASNPPVTRLAPLGLPTQLHRGSRNTRISTQDPRVPPGMHRPEVALPAGALPEPGTQDWVPLPTPGGGDRLRWHNPISGEALYRQTKPPISPQEHAQRKFDKENAPPLVRGAGVPAIEAKAKLFFGEDFDPKDLHRLAGSPPGSEINLSGWLHNQIGMEGKSHQFQNLDRTLKAEKNGDLVLHSDYNRVRKKHQGKGIGAKMFANQVQAALDLGVDRITNLAARAPGADGFNGYATWPRLGYDAPIPSSQRWILPPSLRGAATVQDLYATEEGRKWWEKHGDTTNMTFDLTPGSRSLKVLSAYRVSKGFPPIQEPDPAALAARKDARRARIVASFAPPPSAAPLGGGSETTLPASGTAAEDKPLDVREYEEPVVIPHTADDVHSRYAGHARTQGFEPGDFRRLAQDYLNDEVVRASHSGGADIPIHEWEHAYTRAENHLVNERRMRRLQEYLGSQMVQAGRDPRDLMTRALAIHEQTIDPGQAWGHGQPGFTDSMIGAYQQAARELLPGKFGEERASPQRYAATGDFERYAGEPGSGGNPHQGNQPQHNVANSMGGLPPIPASKPIPKVWPLATAALHPVVPHIEALPGGTGTHSNWDYHYPHHVAHEVDQYLGGHRGLPGSQGKQLVPEASDYLHARHAQADLPQSLEQARALERLLHDAHWLKGQHREQFQDQQRPLADTLAQHGGYLTRLRRPAPAWRISGEGPFKTQQEAEDFAQAEVGVPWRIRPATRGGNTRFYIDLGHNGEPPQEEYVPRAVGPNRHEWFRTDTEVPHDDPLPLAVGRDLSHTLPQTLPGDMPGARPLGAQPPGRLQNRELTPLERVLAGLEEPPHLDRHDPTYRALLEDYRHGDAQAGGILGDYLKEGGHLRYQRDADDAQFLRYAATVGDWQAGTKPDASTLRSLLQWIESRGSFTPEARPLAVGLQKLLDRYPDLRRDLSSEDIALLEGAVRRGANTDRQRVTRYADGLDKPASGASSSHPHPLATTAVHTPAPAVHPGSLSGSHPLPLSGSAGPMAAPARPAVHPGSLSGSHPLPLSGSAGPMAAPARVPAGSAIRALPATAPNSGSAPVAMPTHTITVGEHLPVAPALHSTEAPLAGPRSWQAIPHSAAEIQGMRWLRRGADSINPTYELHDPKALKDSGRYIAKMPLDTDFSSRQPAPAQVATELAANRIHQLLGTPNVPSMTSVDKEGRSYIVTPRVAGPEGGQPDSVGRIKNRIANGNYLRRIGRFAPAAQADYEKALVSREQIAAQNHPDDLGRMKLANWFLNGQDRHAGNYLLGSNHEIVPIDYGMAFHPHSDTDAIHTKKDALDSHVRPEQRLDRAMLQRIGEQRPEIERILEGLVPHYGDRAGAMWQTMQNKFAQAEALARHPDPRVRHLPEDPVWDNRHKATI